MTEQKLELTERQKRVYDYIQEQIDTWGYPPTIREIAQALNIRSTNGVADHLKALKKKGFLTQQAAKSRTLRLEQPQVPSHTPHNVVQLLPTHKESIVVPLLGRVAAGEPILAEEQAMGSIVVDSLLIGRGKKVFALKVVGESMIDDGIFDGDYIFVKKRSFADSGEIVVVVIDNEATLKRYYPEGNRIRLQPANSKMKPIYVKQEEFKQIQILGVVVGVYRKVNAS